MFILLLARISQKTLTMADILGPASGLALSPHPLMTSLLRKASVSFYEHPKRLMRHPVNLSGPLSRSSRATSFLSSSCLSPISASLPPSRSFVHRKKPKPTPSDPFTTKRKKQSTDLLESTLVAKYSDPTSSPSSPSAVNVRALQRARRGHVKTVNTATRQTTDLLGESFRDFTSLLTTLRPLPAQIALEEAELVVSAYAKQVSNPQFLPYLTKDEEIRKQLVMATKQMVEIYELWLTRTSAEDLGGLPDEQVNEWMRLRRQRMYLVVSEVYRNLDALKELQEMLEFAGEKGMLDEEFFGEVHQTPFLYSLSMNTILMARPLHRL
jgi:hypothetical protein